MKYIKQMETYLNLVSHSLFSAEIDYVDNDGVVTAHLYWEENGETKSLLIASMNEYKFKKWVYTEKAQRHIVNLAMGKGIGDYLNSDGTPIKEVRLKDEAKPKQDVYVVDVDGEVIKTRTLMKLLKTLFPTVKPSLLVDELKMKGVYEFVTLISVNGDRWDGKEGEPVVVTRKRKPRGEPKPYTLKKHWVVEYEGKRSTVHSLGRLITDLFGEPCPRRIAKQLRLKGEYKGLVVIEKVMK